MDPVKFDVQIAIYILDKDYRNLISDDLFFYKESALVGIMEKFIELALFHLRKHEDNEKVKEVIDMISVDFDEREKEMGIWTSIPRVPSLDPNRMKEHIMNMDIHRAVHKLKKLVE